MSSNNSPAAGSSSNNISCSRDFETFLQGWLIRQQHFYELLQTTLKNIHQHEEDDLNVLVSKVLSHYHLYYERKSEMATHNVFLVFSPTWFTPFEKTFFWVGGFRPSLAFKVMETVIRSDEMTELQRQRMDMLKDNVAREEAGVAKEMASTQEKVATDQAIMEAVKKMENLVNGEIVEVDAVLRGLRMSMETVLTWADSLRVATAGKVTQILTPVQCIKFLAAATKLQLRIRARGMQLIGGN
ncbi:DOG1 domain-containing protein [Heracleum sosnowskyi]|uniref:DOG1 domain-containing protein n=1 Tax=Heracleum sosnowskyi TaxID=360622 RepID=A0AAD8J808_9APIA|nr:DOG1 domain-containing protein [Heracleum sosnowskyi]